MLRLSGSYPRCAFYSVLVAIAVGPVTGVELKLFQNTVFLTLPTNSRTRGTHVWRDVR